MRSHEGVQGPLPEGGTALGQAHKRQVGPALNRLSRAFCMDLGVNGRGGARRRAQLPVNCSGRGYAMGADAPSP